VDKISDPKNVKKSKQFPFRFYNAFNAFEGKQEVRDALTDALEVSFENLEKLPGRVAISNDVSGSMGCPVSDRGKTRYCDIAGLFAASIFKKSEDVILLPADDHVHNVKVSKRSTIMDIASKIGSASGGTNLGAPVSWLIKNKHVVDTYIGITDNEDWAAGYWGRGFLTEWQDYKAKVNPNAKAILITISPYRDFVAPTSEKDVHFIIGWSDAVLRYIPLIMSENKGQVEGVRKIDLTKLNAKA
jgi:60 kDa SS-A/Ro ribonucleoprotein